MVGAGGTPATPAFVEGKTGKALQLDGRSAMRARMDLHPDNCPQLTISAWIKASSEATEGHVLLSEGEEGPGLHYFSGSLSMLGPGYGVTERDVLYPDAWMFVALVYNPQDGVQRLHWGGRSSQEPMGERRLMPGPALWVGAYGQRIDYAPRGIDIDRPDQSPELSYATAGLAGRWLSLKVSGDGTPVASRMDAPSLELEFNGPDSDLSGTITVHANFGFGGLNIPDA